MSTMKQAERYERFGLYHLTVALLLGVVIGASLILGIALTAPAHAAEVNHHHRILRACLSDEGESAFPCAWYAPGMGNHLGHSFRIYRDGRVKQITDARAFELLGDCDSDGPLYC
jgi:hypothetical protein